MNAYLVVLSLAAIALLQTTLAPRLSFVSAMPQFMLLTVVLSGFLRSKREGALLGFVGGLMLDLLSGGPFGIITLSLLLAGYLAGSRELYNVVRGTVVVPLVIVVLSTLFYNVIILVVLQLLGQPVAWESAFLRAILPAVLLNILFMPMVYVPLRHLHRLTGPPRINW